MSDGFGGCSSLDSRTQLKYILRGFNSKTKVASTLKTTLPFRLALGPHEGTNHALVEFLLSAFSIVHIY